MTLIFHFFSLFNFLVSSDDNVELLVNAFNDHCQATLDEVHSVASGSII